MKVPSVLMPDIKTVLEYLNGKISECQQIDSQMRAQTLVKKIDIRMGKTI